MSRQRRKLIETALPLEAIDRACVREKSIRHGHPSTLHLWWARRPLAAARAAIWASLVDDPAGDESLTPDQQRTERQRLFSILEELLVWENTSDQEVLKRAHAEVKRSCGGVPPAILDPFGGGGSIPLEAQRLGLTVLAGDLNPVAVLIQKALVEIPPRFTGIGPVNPDVGQRLSGWHGAQGLSEDVAAYGRWMRDAAREHIGDLYPMAVGPDGEELTPVAWLWVRTVPSPDPAWSGQVPLIKTWELKRRPGKPRVWFEPVVDRERQDISKPFRIREGGKPVLEPTMRRGNGVCLATGAAMTNEYIVEQFNAGNASEQLVAIVADGGRGRGRVYLEVRENHSRAARIRRRNEEFSVSIPTDGLSIRVPRYGFSVWPDLFTPRQLTAMVTFSDLLGEVWNRVKQDAIVAGMADDGVRLRDGGAGAAAYADAVVTYLALAVDRLADYCNCLCTWNVAREQMRNLFARHAIPMTWDIAEVNPFSSSSGNWLGAIEWVRKVVRELPAQGNSLVLQRDARGWNFGQQGVVVCTDPPYYDNIDYSSISDFFYFWLRRNLTKIWPNEFSTLATPKAEELTAIAQRRGRDQARDHFERGMREFLGKLAREHRRDFPISIFYAYKASEGRGGRESGWSTFLQALVDSGLQITATWPVRTERQARALAIGTNSLASSVILVCRPRGDEGGVVSRSDFVSALRAQLPGALELLLESNIAPVDLPQATIGPAMKIFSGYAAVVQADGSNMRASAALSVINQYLGEFFNGVEVELDPDSRFAYDWYRSHGFGFGLAGDADSIAQAKGTSLEGISAAGIGSAVGGKFSLVDRGRLEPDWEPGRDRRATVWEAVQHLISRLDASESEAVRLYVRMGALREGVRDLAYMLYRAADERQDAQEALAYNGLVSALPVIAERARGLGAAQGVLFGP